MQEEQPKTKKYSASTIIITSLAVIIILVLAFFLYYYSASPVPSVPEESGGVSKVVKENVAKEPEIAQIAPTNVVNFAPPQTLPTVQKSGKCFSSSIAQPYRQDAFRCQVLNQIYDPCFTTTRAGVVFCQMNPLATDTFLIKLTQALPKAPELKDKKTNWAWFLKLENGAICSPFTGTRPSFGGNKIAYYGCKSDNKDEQVVLLGDLTEGYIWLADEAVLVKSGANWTIKSSRQVNIDTVWK